MTQEIEDVLLDAVLHPHRADALAAIREACAAGANPNAAYPQRTTAQGTVSGGRTLLTQAIVQGAPEAVVALLDAGADPHLADDLGWTPWIASTLSDHPEGDRIQSLLLRFGAAQSDSHLAALAGAILQGDVDAAKQHLHSPRDLQLLSHYRLDLVGHQVRFRQPAMLEWLLDQGMAALASHLTGAVRGDNLRLLNLLLASGLAPESDEQRETPLMQAAALGYEDIAKRLLAAGASPARYADDDGDWTPACYARQAGHLALAELLEAAAATPRQPTGS